jgi:hypothetical protein
MKEDMQAERQTDMQGDAQADITQMSHRQIRKHMRRQTAA